MSEIHPQYLPNELPAGLEKAIFQILSRHIGRSNPISRRDLCRSLRLFNISERAVREQIRQMRRSGHLIGSAAGVNGGYYLISTPQEFREFLISEYLAKIKDMRETVNAMKQSADQQWGARSLQLDLF